ncbi:response regulator [Adhaeribacter radiodurans]|uniref:Response regulator transcription factor n=1 Tax=Adhaeribacter radiodurans TaxID=2745197 RepID=A0A7L7L1P9_9BACT|nr:response regulator transcription factor [Adhaeribacter radiodurans]QMU26717.1 response regulator transcription factor [Adhaeribacter radiodurans]
MSSVKLAIIDDHQVVINGMLAMFADSAEVNIAFTTTSSQELLQYLQHEQPDIIILDIQMPEVNGVDLTKQILKQHRQVKIIAFSSFAESQYVKQVLRNGASGYLLKNANLATLLKAIKAVNRGEEFIDEAIKNILLQESITGQRRSLFEIPLTKREKEILKLIAEENSNQEIADKLFLSLRTVETHRFNLTQKLGAKNTVSLVKEAIKRGLID